MRFGTNRPIFLRPSPIERMGKFAEKNWIWAAGLFLVWVFWRIA